ncbi:4-hydroxybenzoate transporter PcaK [Burkholderia multivorans]|nr:4-hydroxybenzoate transporter PcaK [Burkholderia multivorans]MDR8772808.1 4-hydroxybenzoate transporter PcaK [Burkholderia multivorans]MDR8861536.1 4-hydroxybenzoate transporter PcaK [Burkholderia multivorans]
MKQATTDSRTVNVQDLIDSQRFSGFHWTILVLCFLVVALDGFDTGAMGFIAPSLVQDWKISRDTLGPVLSAALVGLGVGALMAGPIADRIGRKAVLIGSVFFFGVWSVAAARATSMEALTVFRLLTGLGLGAAVPNAVTLMSEYAPRRIRGFVVNAMFMGFAAGLAMGGVVAALLIPRFGWPSVLLAGGHCSSSADGCTHPVVARIREAPDCPASVLSQGGAASTATRSGHAAGRMRLRLRRTGRCGCG